MGPRNRQELFAALEHDEIIPYFQPLVELRSGVLTGFEVLARWIHPSDGVITPDQFIPLAEETGCVGELTERLLRRVFAAAPAIPPHITIAVNLSPLQFRDDQFPEKLARAAAAGSFPLDRMVLEVTESALVGNIAQAREISVELKKFGVKLALDDFGTGYSSLKHLQALPFDELKVDAGFVRSMGVTRESRKIAAAVVGLGQSLGLTTVAEGVETRNQAEMLLWLGCDQGQGWLYGRPIPAERLHEVLGRESLLGDDQGEDDYVCGPIAPRIEALPSQRLSQLQAIYDGIPVGLCFLDRAMRFLSVNQHLADTLGRSIGDHLGRTLKEVLPQRWEYYESLLRRVLEGESIHGLEVWDRRLGPSLMQRVFSLYFEPARDEAGEIVGVSIAVLNVSDEKQAVALHYELEMSRKRIVELERELAAAAIGARPMIYLPGWSAGEFAAD